jgi:pimeloyl-ACP methyl ester carboxylesterase
MTLMLTAATLAAPSTSAPFRVATLVVRGRPQLLRLYGDRTAEPVIVSSGDGGWMHLGPHIAETLAEQGFFVVGFDVRAYLRSFTDSSATLRAQDEPSDYGVLADYAARGATKKPILIGVSEGAGLSVLAATNPDVGRAIAGVIGVGLPAENELGWRLTDSVIYLTHGVPREPTFATADVIGQMAGVPLAAIQSTHDEFAPIAEVRTILELAHEPKSLWVIDASNHRFSGNVALFDRRLIEAMTWVRQHQR